MNNFIRKSLPVADSEPELYSLLDAPPAGTFDTFALVSHARHLDELGTPAPGTLVVASDWLLYQQCRSKGIACVTLDAGLQLWQGADTLAEDANLRAADWAYDGDEDVTVFEGVSLGRLFSPRVVTCLVALTRMDRALRALIAHYRVKRIVAYDCISSFGAADPKSCQQLIADIAAELDIAIQHCWMPLTGADANLPFEAEPKPVISVEAGAWARLKSMVRGLYSISVDGISRLRCRDDQNRVLLVLINQTLNLLVREFPAQRVTPVILFESNDKKPGTVLRRLMDGVLIAGKRSRPLDRDALARVQEIEAALSRRLERPARSIERGVNDFVNRSFVADGQLRALAADVLASHRVLKRFRPARIVVDGVRNAPVRSFIDISAQMGIPVDYTWHSPISPKRHKWDAFGNDPRTPGTVSRGLSWGPVFDKWMSNVSDGIPCVTTGTTRVPDHVTAEKSRRTDRILILDYNNMADDVTALDGWRYEFFVKTVRLLRRQGYTDIAIKLHPGRPRQAYYEAVANKFALDCRVFKKERLSDVLENFDVVIGPLYTSARLEALALGKRYIGFFIPPNAFDHTYYDDEPHLTRIDQLPEALATGRYDDNEAILRRYNALDPEQSPAAQFWAAFT